MGSLDLWSICLVFWAPCTLRLTAQGPEPHGRREYLSDRKVRALLEDKLLLVLKAYAPSNRGLFS